MRAAGIILALLGAFAIGPALAQLFSPSQFYPAVVVSYTGPGDVVSGAKGWWGLRAYNAAYATGSNNAINIRRASDNSTSNIAILSNGNFDVATATTFCASTSCFVTESFDQTGNGVNLSQGTASVQPQLIFNCLGSLPCMKFAGGQSMGQGTVTALIQPISTSLVAIRTGITFSNDVYVGAHGGGGDLGIRDGRTSSNTWQLYAGTGVNFTVSDNSAHAAQAVFNGASGAFNLDGTDNTSQNFGSNASQTVIGIVGEDALAVANVKIMEGGVWNNTGFTSSNRTSLCHNQFTYWGTVTSC